MFPTGASIQGPAQTSQQQAYIVVVAPSLVVTSGLAHLGETKRRSVVDYLIEELRSQLRPVGTYPSNP